MVTIGRLRLAMLAALLIPVPVVAQEQTGRLTVVDAAGVPVPFAVVTVGKSTPRVADDSGRLLVPATDDDSLQVNVRRIGYQEFHGMLPRAADGRYVVTLSAISARLAAVTVVERANTPLANRGFYDRVERVQNGAIVGSFFTPEDLDDMNQSTVSGMLRRSAHVRITRSRPSRGAPQTLVLGRGGCGMNIVIDGQLATGTVQDAITGDARTSISSLGTMGGGGGGDLVDIDQLVDGRSIMAIEVYPSTANAPAEIIPFGGRGSCGIVAIWTGGRR